MKLTVIFDGKGINEDDGSLFDIMVAKSDQGVLFYGGYGQLFDPIDSYDLRIVDGEKYLVGAQPFASDMPIT